METSLNRLKLVVNGGATALLLGITEAIFAVTFGSLVFSGAFDNQQATGIGLALMSTAVIMVLTSLTSSVRGSIGTIQDAPTIILAVMSGHLTAEAASISPDALLPTLLFLMVGSTALTGILLWIVGRFRLGRLFRFLPYPVVGGFLAGTGLLIMIASFDIMTGQPLTFQSLPGFFEASMLIRWIPGVVFALLMFIGSYYTDSSLTLPFILIGSISLYHIVLLFLGIAPDQAALQGLLLSIPDDFTWRPFVPSLVSNVDWRVVLGELDHALVMFALSIIGLLLNLQGIEAGLEADYDTDTELERIGLINLASGFLGGFTGFHAVGTTMLGYRLGGRGRLIGVVMGLVCLGVLFLGTGILRLFPVSLLGGMLLFLGLDFFYEWVIAAFKRFALPEYIVLLLILLIIVTTDFLIGIVVGLVSMVIMFAFNYSRINAIEHELNGQQIQSNTWRSAEELKLLDRRGKEITVLKLNGYIFFGSMTHILDRMRELLESEREAAVHYIILDFERVVGLDTSSIHGFSKIWALVRQHDVSLMLTDIPEDLYRIESISKSGLHLLVFENLNEALEWCEEQLLKPASSGPVEMETYLQEKGLSSTEASEILSYLEPLSVSAGTTIVHKDDPDHGVYFVERGRVIVHLGDVELLTLTGGTVFGEVSTYLETRRTASVTAEFDSRLYLLTNEAIRRLEAEKPELAIWLHRFLASHLSRRLVQIDAMVQALK